MAKNLTQKLLDTHRQGDGFRADHTLVHDMSGLLAFMGFEAMGLDRIGVEKAFIFNDHNLTYMSPATASDQNYLHSCARRYGAVYSRPGNGICHSLYLHGFARPGALLLGADSHTATAGAVGMLGIGMGGLDIGAAMSGSSVALPEPKVIQVYLTGKLKPGVTAKDGALALLAKVGIKGFLGAVAEYTGPGTRELTVPQRCTFANMGAEAGATSSVFPADDVVLDFLRNLGREADFTPLCGDNGCGYQGCVELDLSLVEPMAALPGQPDQAKPIRELEKVPFRQVFIGSCTNGAYEDLARAASILKGRKVHPDVDAILACGNRQILRQLQKHGWLETYLEAGVRLLECSCGPCMGIGQAPAPGSLILRSSNRNYPGRSGTPDAKMYLCSAESAAASAVNGFLTSSAELYRPLEWENVRLPAEPFDFGGFVFYGPSDTPLDYGTNIRPMPVKAPMSREIRAEVSLKLGDGISTDDIVPAKSEILTLRPNIPALSQYIFANLDPGFAARAQKLGTSILVAGANYAQGSSREHAAIGCMYLGVQAVMALSIHRIHRANLINYGVLPLTFRQKADLDAIGQGDQLLLPDIMGQLARGGEIRMENLTKGKTMLLNCDLTDRERRLVMAGGLLPHSAGNREGEVR